MKKLMTVFTGMLAACVVKAQDTATQKTEMADLMRSNGKIFVVIAVMLTILAGLILYVVRLDRKITKLEKEQ